MVLKKLREKLKDPGIQMQIAFAGMLIFLYIALVTSGK